MVLEDALRFWGLDIAVQIRTTLALGNKAKGLYRKAL